MKTGPLTDTPCPECGETAASPSAYRHSVCLLKATARPETHTSGSGAKEPNPYRGLRCPTCGQVVKQKDSPAQMHTDLEAGTVTARHLYNCV